MIDIIPTIMVLMQEFHYL